MNQKKAFLSVITLIFVISSTKTISATTSASSLFEPNTSVSRLEYQQAAAYSHLNWSSIPNQPISIQILPVKNYSGIPLQLRAEKADYFNHGKIPQQAQELFADLTSASRYFNSKGATPDYHFQLTIEKYQLPFDYAPDDIWWEELNANVDRWFATANNANLKLSLRVTSANKYIANWTQSIETTLSYCDLNQQSQPLTSVQNQQQTLAQYVQTTSGQAFIAASNYLILQAILYINQKPSLARVIRKEQNEIFIQSDSSSFVLGEKLALYHQRQGRGQSALPAGLVQIIKTYQNQAIAYPVNLRLDQIKAGDWVEVGETYPYLPPKSIFKAKNQCAQVSVATAE